MREKHTVRLTGVDIPGHLPADGDILLIEFQLLFAVAQQFTVALHAALEFGDAGKGAVLPVEMAALAAVIHLVQVYGVVEVDWLFFLGVKQLQTEAFL